MANPISFLFLWPLISLNYQIRYGKLGTLVLSYEENQYRVIFDNPSRIFDCTWDRNDISASQVTFEFQRLLRRIRNQSRNSFQDFSKFLFDEGIGDRSCKVAQSLTTSSSLRRKISRKVEKHISLVVASGINPGIVHMNMNETFYDVIYQNSTVQFQCNGPLKKTMTFFHRNRGTKSKSEYTISTKEFPIADLKIAVEDALIYGSKHFVCEFMQPQVEPEHKSVINAVEEAYKDFLRLITNNNCCA